jgi:hypothetical protein
MAQALQQAGVAPVAKPDPDAALASLAETAMASIATVPAPTPVPPAPAAEPEAPVPPPVPVTEEAPAGGPDAALASAIEKPKPVCKPRGGDSRRVPRRDPSPGRKAAGTPAKPRTRKAPVRKPKSA